MIEEKDNFYQGEDIDCAFTLYQLDGITLLPINGVGVLVYAIIYDGYRNIKAQYHNAAAGSGWETIDSSNFSTSVVKFKIMSEVTKYLEPGIYYVEVKVRYPSGGYTDGYYDVPAQATAFKLRESIIKSLV